MELAIDLSELHFFLPDQHLHEMNILNALDLWLKCNLKLSLLFDIQSWFEIKDTACLLRCLWPRIQLWMHFLIAWIRNGRWLQNYLRFSTCHFGCLCRFDMQLFEHWLSDYFALKVDWAYIFLVIFGREFSSFFLACRLFFDRCSLSWLGLGNDLVL